MKKLSFLNKVIYFVNVIVALALLFSFILPYLPPKTFAVLSVLNLGVSFLFMLNILFALYWVIRLKRQFILSFLVLFLGYMCYGSLYRFSSSESLESEESFKVMNYNVRLFNLYHWIKEDAVETKIIDLIKRETPDILSVQEYHPHKNIDLSFFKYKFEKLSGEKNKIWTSYFFSVSDSEFGFY